MPVLPPTEESTCASSVVGIWIQSTPRRIVVAACGSDVGDTLVADHLGDLRVGVESRKFVFLFQQRIKNKPVGKLFCQLKVFNITSNFSYIRKHFIQSAVFAAQHILNLFIRQAGSYSQKPVGKIYKHAFSFFVSGKPISITEACKCFVDVV